MSEGGGGGKPQRRPRKEDDPPQGAPTWMVTFADMMTLLLCFFVLLLSMSTLDVRKVREAMGSMQGALGLLSASSDVVPRRNQIVDFLPVQMEQPMATTLQRVKSEMAEHMTDNMIQVSHTDRAIFLEIPDSLLFAPGSTTIHPAAFEFLGDLGEALSSTDSRAEFIGYTDSTPSRGTSNWLLGAERAYMVMEYVLETHPDLDPERLKLGSRGEFGAKTLNDSLEGRLRNRRVVVKLHVGSESDEQAFDDVF